MKSKCMTVAAIGLFALTALPVAAQAGPQGTWLSQKGDLKVRIADCGGSRLCGTVVWLGKPTDPGTGRPKTDKKTPIRQSRHVPCSACRWRTA